MAKPTDMTHPVTRAELDEVVDKLRSELRSELHELRSELRTDMSAFATRDELAALRTDMNNSFVSIARQFADIDVRFDEVNDRFDRLPAEIASYNRALQEVDYRRELRAVDDKYADLPARVKKLEERPAPRANARRRTRAS